MVSNREEYDRVVAEAFASLDRSDAMLQERQADPLAAVSVERLNDRHRRELDEQEARFRIERRAPRRPTDAEAARAALEREQPPFDWWAEIDRRIETAVAAERERASDLLSHLIAEMRAEASDTLKRATTAQAVEIANLKVVIAELRVEVATERTKAATAILDLPTIPLRGSRTN
jgi:hypothetical protein